MARLLREKRMARGLSMYALAKRAGISHSTMARIENQGMKPTLDMLLRVTEAMGVDLWPLVKEAENRFAPLKKKNP